MMNPVWYQAHTQDRICKKKGLFLQSTVTVNIISYMVSFFNSLVLIVLRITESCFFPSIKSCIPGIISDCVTSISLLSLALYNILSSKWSWIVYLLTILSEPFFFQLLSFIFYSFEDKPPNQLSFLLYIVLPFNALAVISSTKYYYSMFSVMLSGFLLDKCRVFSLFLILSSCIGNPAFSVLCGFLFFPSLFSFVSPLLFLLLLHSSEIVIISSILHNRFHILSMEYFHTFILIPSLLFIPFFMLLFKVFYTHLYLSAVMLFVIIHKRWFVSLFCILQLFPMKRVLIPFSYHYISFLFVVVTRKIVSVLYVSSFCFAVYLFNYHVIMIWSRMVVMSLVSSFMSVV